MTESEWLACPDSLAMLSFIWDRPSPRKRRLFACACVRAHWHLLVDERGRDLIRVAEGYADGEVAEELLEMAMIGAVALREDVINGRAKSDRLYLHDAVVQAVQGKAIATAQALAWDVASGFRSTSKFSRSEAWHAARARELMHQAGLVREVFGNPFLAETTHRARLTPGVLTLARSIYLDRAFDRMTSLGDAIEEAGCCSSHVLAHCRQPGGHVHGCWALDAILGND